MSETTVWENTPAKEFDWEAEAFYTVQSPENISPLSQYANYERARGGEWYILPIPDEVREELQYGREAQKVWVMRSAQWYAEKYPDVPIRVVRHTFETDTA